MWLMTMSKRNLLHLLSRAYRWALTYWRIKKDPVAYARSLGVKIGEDVRLGNLNAGTFGTEPNLVEIGNHVTVASRVQFITHDGGVWVFRETDPDINSYGPIIVGNNVFIGFGVIILPDVRIGNDVVIGAGAVVTKNIPSGSVAVGCPARVIRTVAEYRQSVNAKIAQGREALSTTKRRR